ncbi:MAG: HEAT repeat domain-containing protein [Deltaproteobacteria bacterium]|nr:HEAT repeat domain-containing protein [Deltaproteobacteria bacterium]
MANDPFDIESEPNDDLAAFDDSPVGGGMVLGDDNATLKKINQRSSMVGKLIFATIVLGAAGVGVWAYMQSEAYDHRMEVFEPVEEMTDASQRNAALREILANAGFEDVKQRAIMNLGHFEDAEAVPLLIEKLQEAGVVRRSAAWALAEIGPPAADNAVPTLLQVLPDTDERDRNQVIWTLAVLRSQDQAFIDAMLDAFSKGDLQHIPGFDHRLVTEVLGVDRLSSPDLTGHETEAVRLLTAHALAEVETAAVIEPLARMLEAEIAMDEDDQSTEVIRASAAGLGRIGEAAAARPLFAALQANRNLEGTILDALEKSTAGPDLAVFMHEASEVEMKRSLARLVEKTHDRRTADALAQLLDHEDQELRSIAALALANFSDQRAKPVLYALTTVEDNDDLVSDAIEALRWVVDESDTDKLVEMMETHPYRKAAILRNLGATGDPAAARPMEKELEGDDVRAAGMSLGDLNDDGSFRDLLKMVDRGDVEMGATNAADRSLVNEELLGNRRAAILAMGRYGRLEAVEALMEVVEDDLDDYELRGLAAASIGQIADDDTMRNVINKVQSPDVRDNAKRYYVQALWQKPHRDLNPLLLELMASDQPAEVKRAAAIAVGYSGDPAVDERLANMLDDEAHRRDAAVAIVLGGGQASAEKLVATLATDGDLREVLQMWVMNEENDWFNLLTTDMFENGAIWRRLKVAEILREGDGDNSYAYPWAKAVAVLRSGWDGVGGLRPQLVRDKLWEAMEGDDEEKRMLVAAAFHEIPETGLLLRARDEGGAMEEAARSVLDGTEDE